MRDKKQSEVKKICDTCRWAGKGDGKTLLIGDIVCVNDKSEHIADFVSKNDTCKLWEAEE